MVHANVVSHVPQDSSLGNGTPSSPKQVHFVNTSTIVSGLKKEEEDELETSKVEEKGESSIISKDAKSSDNKTYKHETNIREEEEWIESQGYKHRGLNFVRMGIDMHVFVESMSYITDFTILENVEANIDLSLSQIVFGRPFVEATRLLLDSKKGLITFTYGIQEVTFKTQCKYLEMDDLTSERHDLLSSRLILSDNDVMRRCESPGDLKSGFYKDINKLGPLYRKDGTRIERFDLEIPSGSNSSRTDDGVT
ncbi:hypothetical protein Tco_1491105 [Tanacetum coccineum]